MSDLGFNKIAFCVLGTALAVIGLNEASHAMFVHEKHDHPGYLIDVPTEGVVVAEDTGPVDYGTLLAAADIAAGAEQSKKCVQCHAFAEGAAPLQGPTLYGVLGRDIASVPGFAYSTGANSLSDKPGAWDYESLDHFIERPKGFASATNMNFAGINSRITGQKDRMNLIAYLRTLGSESIPLPAPLPAAAPADAAAPVDGATPPADGATPPADGAAPAPATPAPATPAPH